MESRPRVLVVSTLYPNPAEPVFGVFVHRRISHVSALAEVKVLSPIPWFPLGTLLKRYRHRAQIPAKATFDGIAVDYPRFLSIPRFWKPLDGIFLFLTLLVTAKRLQRGFDFDLVDAHLAYPDGYAAVLLGRMLKKPVTITLRGHDINHTPQYPVRRKQVVYALKKAARVMSVAEALRQEAIELGCPGERSETVPNGVETSLFFIKERKSAREKLGLPTDAKIVLSVGHMVERKGHHLIAEAVMDLMTSYPSIIHVAVGGPSEEGNYLPFLLELCERLDISDRVRAVGARPNEELIDWYNAADVFCLASSKEGRANVLLEALACGTPVVATDVWGTPEVISSPELGVLVPRNVPSIRDGIEQALHQEWDREKLSAYARSFTWENVAKNVVRNYKIAIDGSRGRAR